LNACGQPVNDNKKPAKALYIVDSLSLQPFTILATDGKEKNALIHAFIINDLQCNCDSVGSLLLNPPFTKLLYQLNYVELSLEICNLSNQNWEFYSRVKFATAKLFSGSVLHNTNDGQAVVVNTVEAYGQTKLVDSHCESCGMIKCMGQTISIRPPIPKLYPDICLSPYTILTARSSILEPKS
jgi:hypothetical protein